MHNTYDIIATPQLSSTNPTIIESDVPSISLSIPYKVTIESVDISIPSNVPYTPLKIGKVGISKEDMSSIINSFSSIVNDTPPIEIDYSKVKDILNKYPMINLEDKNLEEVD